MHKGQNLPLLFRAGDSKNGYQEYEDDPDRSKISDVLDFDLHAIYKKDGLRFDESWQVCVKKYSSPTILYFVLNFCCHQF